MSWKCPDCGRTFAHRGQAHACRPSDISAVAGHLTGPRKDIVEALVRFAKTLDGVKVEGASGSIMVKAPATFLSIRPRAKDVQVTFMLDEEIDTFPIAKSLRSSRHRVAHALFLDDVADIDAQLHGWIARAHALTRARGGSRRS